MTDFSVPEFKIMECSDKYDLYLRYTNNGAESGHGTVWSYIGQYGSLQDAAKSAMNEMSWLWNDDSNIGASRSKQTVA